ncbi:glycoside hydrolase family 5 protein [Xanthobacter wiegelii]|uniref:glycoside hydrolase family 5 protein n=1 Tax=Xanthobacter wiegelii TaxID=3119913 RepID=UPI003727758F
MVVALAILMLAPDAASASEMKRGLGVGGPFASFVTRDGQAGGKDAPEQVFRGIGDYLNQKNYVASDIRAMGFDFVRVSINPAILLRSEGPLRDELFAELRKGVDYYRGAGLKVLFNLQFWTPDPVWNWESVLNPQGGQFEAYREIVRRSAELLASYPQGDVSFEPMNEPASSNCEDPKTGWLAKQRTLLADIRAISPTLPVLVSGCVGQLDGLLTLDKSNIDMSDPNLLYSFHFYEPFFFTHQTSPTNFPHIDTVPYPASSAPLTNALAAAIANIKAASIPDDQKTREENVARREFFKYAVLAPDRAFIKRRLATVSAWAKKNGIPPDRIIMGEFAALNWSDRDSEPYRRSRVAWDRDVRAEAEAAGFAWAFWVSPLKDDISEALDLPPSTTPP